ncbi:MAG: MOSC domain-containing protein [Gemmatimonadaceae bacterium]|nr:MOSC domain-containing protein [Gemmatimonadaceae bacterium]
MTNDSSPRVAGLFVHPIKSAGAIAVQSLALDDRGAIGDRRWLVVDPAGRQITARDTPRLTLVRPSFAMPGQRPLDRATTIRALGGASIVSAINTDGALVVHAPHETPLVVDIPTDGAVCRVSIWDDMVEAIDAGDTSAEWMSRVLGRPARLMRLSDDARRPLRAKFAGDLPYQDRRVAFSDGAPLLILGQGSIDALNDRLLSHGEQTTMTAARFRPNVLLTHLGAHDEDRWSRVHIGTVDLAIGEPCSRCVMITLDPETAEGGVEPLRTLADYRRQQGSVMFGMNATHAEPGTIRLGDQVAVRAVRD